MLLETTLVYCKYVLNHWCWCFSTQKSAEVACILQTDQREYDNWNYGLYNLQTLLSEYNNVILNLNQYKHTTIACNKIMIMKIIIQSTNEPSHTGKKQRLREWIKKTKVITNFTICLMCQCSLVLKKWN